jgi:hypothetical protein
MAKTYKREIALEYCTKYQNFSTRAIARLLLKDFPLDFTESNARSMVQHIRGEKGKGKGEMQRSEKTKKQFMARKFELPESDYEERQILSFQKVKTTF